MSYIDIGREEWNLGTGLCVLRSFNQDKDPLSTLLGPWVAFLLVVGDRLGTTHCRHPRTCRPDRYRCTRWYRRAEICCNCPKV